LDLVVVECGVVLVGEYLQAAAVRMTRRAQWFLINLPMVAIKGLKERIRAVDRARGVEKGKQKRRREEKV
jgi:hypothetical protein